MLVVAQKAQIAGLNDDILTGNRAIKLQASEISNLTDQIQAQAREKTATGTIHVQEKQRLKRKVTRARGSAFVGWGLFAVTVAIIIKSGE